MFLFVREDVIPAFKARNNVKQQGKIVVTRYNYKYIRVV